MYVAVAVESTKENAIVWQEIMELFRLPWDDSGMWNKEYTDSNTPSLSSVAVAWTSWWSNGRTLDYNN